MDQPEDQAGEVLSLNPDADWLLQLFVKIANSDGIQLPVTLSTNSGLVTGILIGGGEYFELLKQQLSQWAVDAAQPWLDAADEWKKDYDEPTPDPVMVHLKEAKFVAGPGIMPKNSTLWRGQLSSVSGFSLGILSSN
ncbi:hypothetical protein FXN65_10855 [Metapseudomonas lalkuanensis]|uniref:Gas vesicle protein n=1 Tax=Metapseudomonas lalkuanensis TaxID=2604832 RepID=A0A5J6QPM6_9GAMM|nr:hypothetical protein [Pseudomonas lalkuanensis]QEY62549.1 hypothetical protein FXN65_10855 [Pseudomonas lalkuanensis]